MTKINSEKIKLLHQLMAEATGGSVGVRDEGLLDSAVEGAFATFDGVELYPSKEEKAAIRDNSDQINPFKQKRASIKSKLDQIEKRRKEINDTLDSVPKK